MSTRVQDALDHAWERLHAPWLATNSEREKFDAAFAAGAAWAFAEIEAEGRKDA